VTLELAFTACYIQSTKTLSLDAWFSIGYITYWYNSLAPTCLLVGLYLLSFSGSILGSIFFYEPSSSKTLHILGEYVTSLLELLDRK